LKFYNEELLPKHVQALFFDFLLEDSTGMLVFAHESTKSSLVGMKDNVETSNTFSDIRGKTCLLLMNDIDYPAWKYAGFDLRQCHEKFQSVDSLTRTEEISQSLKATRK
jgi:hypothetical protein